MEEYVQVEFLETDAQINEMLVAEMSSCYEGFEEGDSFLKAFSRSADLDKTALDDLAKRYGVRFTVTVIPPSNWNQVWEANFQPVIVGNFCGIRASFHEPFNNVKHEIVITPKMSFGTGHHPTTYMMLLSMSALDISNKQVLDFGTGTGLLAILAKKSGAAAVVAIDHDDWSIENAKENFDNNKVEIQLIKAGSAELDKKFDLILANINKNVIIANIPALSAQLNANGYLLLSGLLTVDEKEILDITSQYQLVLKNKMQRDNWISLLLTTC